MDLIGTELTAKKISEEHDKKTKQVAELMATLEHLRQSLSSSEADRQVSHMMIYGAWLVNRVTALLAYIGTLKHSSLVGRQSCSNEIRARTH